MSSSGRHSGDMMMMIVDFVYITHPYDPMSSYDCLRALSIIYIIVAILPN